MSANTMENDMLSTVKDTMEAYFKTHDIQYVTEDAVFVNMSTGEETKGREAIGEMLHYIYHIAFDASAHFTNSLITEHKAFVEGRFRGTHIGYFAGMPPTNKKVDVPICVTYDLENGFIKKARIYLLGDVLMQQLS